MSTLLIFYSEFFKEGATLSFIEPDIFVNSFMADLKYSMSLQGFCNLLRAPFLINIMLYDPGILQDQFGRFAALLTPAHRQAVGSTGAVAPSGTGSFQLLQ